MKKKKKRETETKKKCWKKNIVRENNQWIQYRLKLSNCLKNCQNSFVQLYEGSTINDPLMNPWYIKI